MSSFDLEEGIISVIVESPLLLVYLVGIVWAAVSWSRHPMVSLLAGLGMGLLAFTALVWEFFRQLATDLYYSRATSSFDDPDVVFNAFCFLRALVNAGLWLLVLFAIFIGRKQPERWAPDVRPASGGYLPPGR